MINVKPIPSIEEVDDIFICMLKLKLKLEWTFKFGRTSAREREYSLRLPSSMC